MSVHVNVQEIIEARAASHDAGTHHRAFDVVDVLTTHGRATLFLPFGAGQNVADAINAALFTQTQKAAQ